MLLLLSLLVAATPPSTSHTWPKPHNAAPKRDLVACFEGHVLALMVPQEALALLVAAAAAGSTATQHAVAAVVVVAIEHRLATHCDPCLMPPSFTQLTTRT